MPLQSKTNSFNALKAKASRIPIYKEILYNKNVLYQKHMFLPLCRLGGHIYILQCQVSSG